MLGSPGELDPSSLAQTLQLENLALDPVPDADSFELGVALALTKVEAADQFLVRQLDVDGVEFGRLHEPSELDACGKFKRLLGMLTLHLFVLLWHPDKLIEIR
jgi:hypothetical protein